MKVHIIGLIAAVFLILMAGNALSEQTIVIKDGGSGEAATGEAVTFECSINATEYAWNFGNGTSVTTNSSTITHVFSDPGKYSVNVSAGGINQTYSMKIVSMSSEGGFLALIGAGLAVGVSGMGAGIGVGIAGAAAAGATANHPQKFAKYFVFQNLAQTQAIYGLLTALLIMFGTGMFGGAKEVPIGVGLVAVGAGLAVGIAGLSAIGQGIAASGAIGAFSENDEAFGKGMVFSALPETQAIYGLLVAILLMVFSGMLGDTSQMARFWGNSGISAGLIGVGAGAAVGIAGLSAIGQGIAAGAGIGAVSEKPEMFGKSIVFSALPETQAIYGLLIAILLMVFGGIVSPRTLPLNMGHSGYVGFGLVGVGAGLAVGIAGLSAIGQGIAASAGIGSTAKKPEMFGKNIVFSALPETQAIYGLLVAILLMVFSGIAGSVPSVFRGSTALTLGLVAVGAGLSIGIAGLSAIGQGIAASAGIGSTAKKPEMFGKAIVFSVLPETQAIYGLLIAILLMVFTGFIGGTRSFGLEDIGIGLAAIGAGLAVGISGLSAIGQGITAAAGISATAKRPESFGRSMIFSVMSETFAIFGLLVAILIIIFAHIMG